MREEFRVKRNAAPISLLCAWLGCSAALGQTLQTGAFVADAGSGCKIWNPHPESGEAVRWVGNCTDGLAQGRGKLEWLRNGVPSERDEGEWNLGRQTGRGIQQWSGGRYDGELLNGEPSGHGVMTLQSSRYEGEFRNGKPNGDGAVTNYQGVFKGKWSNGCLAETKRTVAFSVPSSSCR
ncbi:hypothetical protein [Bradyrhizobium sp.]|uniref:hypothetical protein n=1 Tax=Bradyrhizobium sp. TaxID=376 RepID=UPI003C4D546C